MYFSVFSIITFLGWQNYLLSVSGLDWEYAVNYSPLSFGAPLDKGLYLTVYSSSTLTVYSDCQLECSKIYRYFDEKTEDDLKCASCTLYMNMSHLKSEGGAFAKLQF